MDTDEIEDLFQAATEFVTSKSGGFDTESLLYLYARYKQVKVGPCNTQKPGFFDFQGKAKWDAWKSLGDKKKLNAMNEYVAKVTEKYPDWESQLSSPRKPDKSHVETVFGVAVSTMVNPDKDLADDVKTVFDWCKEGNCSRVLQVLEDNGTHIDDKDPEGMTLLHWACDRGNCDMVEALVKKKATIDIQDADQQTALHYAVICEHPEVVKLLLTHGARTDIPDCDNQVVQDMETSAEIRQILTSYPAS